ncbi:MAG: hypothetical protein ACJA2S_004722, partial [Cyclobacteriaceae bacterium]
LSTENSERKIDFLLTYPYAPFKRGLQEIFLSLFSSICILWTDNN